jgi:Ni/Fe-hydrogenase subunit HybB-like protein
VDSPASEDDQHGYMECISPFICFRCEVLTAVSIKITVVWAVTPYTCTEMIGAVSSSHNSFRNACMFPTWNVTAGIIVLIACAIPPLLRL